MLDLHASGRLRLPAKLCHSTIHAGQYFAIFPRRNATLRSS